MTSERVDDPSAGVPRTPPDAAPPLPVPLAPVPAPALAPMAPASGICAVTGMTPEAGAAPTGELVLSPAVAPGRRRRAWTRLVRFVSRRPSGRHRPGTLDTGWSMFAPQRPRSGRRRGLRA